MVFLENEFRNFYHTLQHKGLWTQAHCHNVNANKLVSRELVYGEEEATKWAKAHNGKGNCFLGRAARDRSGSPVQTSVLTLDLDPERDKGTASTQDQLMDALRCAKRIVGEYKYGSVYCSGNGALILFSCDKALDKSTSEAYHKFLQEDVRKYLTSKIRVDQTHDFSRLVKAMGTISTKGDPTLQRPARSIFHIHGQTGATELLEYCKSNSSQYYVDTKALLSVDKGELDRSRADMALANRLKLQGFSPQDTYKALEEFATREGRKDDYERIVNKIYGRQTVAPMVSGGSRIWTPKSGLAKYHDRQPESIELTTGFPTIDERIRGIRRSSILTVAARTDGGKSTFALGTAFANCEAGRKVLYFSTENEYQEIWDRYFAIALGVSAYKIQDRKLDSRDEQRVGDFVKRFVEEHKLSVYDGSRPSIDEIAHIVKEERPDLVVFDYFQHLAQKDASMLAEVVMRTHEQAREFNFGILMTAQAHERYSLDRKLLPISMQDIKDCHTIEDESRTVLLLDWNTHEVLEDELTPVKVRIAKNKGRKDRVVLGLDRRIPKFIEVENDH